MSTPHPSMLNELLAASCNEVFGAWSSCLFVDHASLLRLSLRGHEFVLLVLQPLHLCLVPCAKVLLESASSATSSPSFSRGEGGGGRERCEGVSPGCCTLFGTIFNESMLFFYNAICFRFLWFSFSGQLFR